MVECRRTAGVPVWPLLPSNTPPRCCAAGRRPLAPTSLDYQGAKRCMHRDVTAHAHYVNCNVSCCLARPCRTWWAPGPTPREACWARQNVLLPRSSASAWGQAGGRAGGRWHACRRGRFDLDTRQV